MERLFKKLPSPLLTIFLHLVSWLLFHANRGAKESRHRSEVYALKNVLLLSFGKLVRTDLQFIGGKPCFSCDGTGEHFDPSSEDSTEIEPCDQCFGTGWYKKPFYSELAYYRLGGRGFHVPLRKLFDTTVVECSIKAGEREKPLITGYVSHFPTRFSKSSTVILLLLFRWSYLVTHQKGLIQIRFNRLREWVRGLIPRGLGRVQTLDAEELPF